MLHDEHERRGAIIHDCRSLSVAEERQMVLQITRATSTRPAHKVEFDGSVSRGSEGHLLRDLRMKRSPSQIGVQDNAGGIDHDLKPAAPVLLQFRLNRTHELLEWDIRTALPQRHQPASNRVNNRG